MIDRARVEFRDRIKQCKYYYNDLDDDDDDDSNDENDSYNYYCCAKHNRLCMRALETYDMIELLRAAESWYKELHRLELPNETFVELFVKSLPEDVFVLMDEIDMTYCEHCPECQRDHEHKEGFYFNVGLMSLAECFCSGCGNGLLLDETKKSLVALPECDCNGGDDVLLNVSNQVYCKLCRREYEVNSYK